MSDNIDQKTPAYKMAGRLIIASLSMAAGAGLVFASIVIGFSDMGLFLLTGLFLASWGVYIWMRKGKDHAQDPTLPKKKWYQV